jgi:hypothetical protein
LSPAEAALEFVRAFNERDLDAFEAVLDPEVEIHSMRGLRQGRPAAREWATRASGGLQQTIRVIRTEARSGVVLFDIDRDWHWDQDGTFAATDEMAWLFEVGPGGLVRSWRSFEDRVEAARAFKVSG